MPKWRRASTFGAGRQVPLDRNQRARFIWLVRADRRHGRLSASGEDVAIELVKLLGEDGRLDPSHATLAARVGCHIATVKRSLNRLRELGRLTWECRLRRDAGTSWRAEQTSNAYALYPACEAHPARAERLVGSKKEALQRDERVETEFENAARQLRAIGFPVPITWGLPGPA